MKTILDYTTLLADKFMKKSAFTDANGLIPLSKGGTGASTAANARTALGLGTAAVLNSTTSVTSGGTNLPTSGAVSNALDSWTPTAQVDSDGNVSFSGLSDSFSYDLYAEDVLVTIISLTKTGSGSAVTLAYETDAPSGTVCKLRILKN